MARTPNTPRSTHRRSPFSHRAFGMVGTLCAVLLATAPSLAIAQRNSAPATAPDSTANAEALSEQAVEAFSSKRYDESIGLFEQAYALDANPNYLFNIGRVYEEKGDLEQAVAHYQKFVSQPGVDLESREAATERLKVLRAALQQLQEESNGEEGAEDEEPPPEESDLKALSGPADSQDDQGPANKKRGQRIAGYALLGVGGAGLIVGGVLGGLAQSNANDADSAEFVDDALRMRDDARRQARAADAMFITGGVLAAAGLVLVLTTLGKGKNKTAAGTKPRRWVLAPDASPRSAGAALHGRF